MLTGVRNVATILLHCELDNLNRLPCFLGSRIVSEPRNYFDILSLHQFGKAIDE